MLGMNKDCNFCDHGVDQSRSCNRDWKKCHEEEKCFEKTFECREKKTIECREKR